MSKVKQAIEKAIENVNVNTRSTYGAHIYTAPQLRDILNDLLKVASEDGTDAGSAVLTRELITGLVGEIEDLVETNIDDINETNIIDEDSIEISLGGGRYTVDNIDVNKAQIVEDAVYNLERQITKWATDNGLTIED
jgi:hypothetical protein